MKVECPKKCTSTRMREDGCDRKRQMLIRAYWSLRPQKGKRTDEDDRRLIGRGSGWLSSSAKKRHRPFRVMLEATGPVCLAALQPDVKPFPVRASGLASVWGEGKVDCAVSCMSGRRWKRVGSSRAFAPPKPKGTFQPQGRCPEKARGWPVREFRDMTYDALKLCPSTCFPHKLPITRGSGGHRVFISDAAYLLANSHFETLVQLSYSHPPYITPTMERTLHGSCSCGRNQYIVQVPLVSDQRASVLFDSSLRTRMPHLQPPVRQDRGLTDDIQADTTAALLAPSSACPSAGTIAPHPRSFRTRNLRSSAAHSSNHPRQQLGPPDFAASSAASAARP